MSFSSAAGGFLGGPWGMAAMAMAPSLFGALAPHDNPRHLRQQALGMFDPRAISNDQNMLFGQLMNGAGMNQARSEMIGAGQTAQNQVNRAVNTRGLGNTGIGAAMGAAAAASPGIHLGQLTANAWGLASQQAQGLAQSRANTIMGMPQSRGMGLPLMGAGMSALMPYLFQLMQQKQGAAGMHPASPIGDAQFPGAWGDWSQVQMPRWN